MRTSRLCSSMLMAIVAAIGCGSGKPQDASAKTERDAPMQLAADTPVSAPAVPAATAPGARGSAVIKGTVTLSGTAPKPEAIKMTADPACQHAGPVYDEAIVADAQGHLKNVLVYVKDGAPGEFPPPANAATLDQNGCWYQPHVFGLQVNQPLTITNSDATLHNVNAKPTANSPFNVAQPVKGMKTTKKFAKPEVPVKFKCNVHPWMHAYAGVFEHPFFNVSNEQGAFTISGLPAGQYTLEAWQEKYGTQTQTVTVGDGETKSVDFSFTAQ